METVLSTSFWNGVIYAMKIIAPLVRVLRLVDGEKRPHMGYIYEAMDKAKEAIKEALGGQRNVRRYKLVWDIVDKRWNAQLHQPLHAAGYYLNPEFFYKNRQIGSCEEVMSGLYDVIERLVPELEIQEKISRELIQYKNAEGIFGRTMVIRQRDTLPPERFKSRNSLDPITLRDIDDCNEWFMGSMQEQLVHENDDLTWNQVAEASGANERCERPTRSRSQRDVDDEPLFESDETDGEEQYIEEADNDSDVGDDEIEDEALLHSLLDEDDE
ncbi:hypothetical protein HHK36_029613 [Tetracentron sinense]|uniref:Uncharacterized protein n=1 Tax=Tetracentron sinense TaxID=13715 RepID=A0A834YBL6_TETSI|nr:hypothetical protein HHK36_029613 [Tetracentron sinense]